MVCDTNANATTNATTNVLILILLEYGLRLVFNETLTVEQFSLNPYSIGIWSATFDFECREHGLSLNPYSIGIWSATPKIANH